MYDLNPKPVMTAGELRESLIVTIMAMPDEAIISGFSDVAEAMYTFEDHQPVYTGQRRKIEIEYFIKHEERND